jgi:putative endonuclease
VTVPPPSAPQPRSPRSQSNIASTREAGLWAETLVARWLTQQGWEILQQRWHCRWGELDLVAHSPNAQTNEATIAFVEVKARSGKSWDLNGRLAITAQKQAKLGKAAAMFLAEHPPLAHLPCRFDVALVQVHPRSAKLNRHDRLFSDSSCEILIELGQPIGFPTCCLSLQHYIPAAFEFLESKKG